MKTSSTTAGADSRAEIDLGQNTPRFFVGEWTHPFGPGLKESRCRLVLDANAGRMLAAQIWTGLRFEGMNRLMHADLEETVIGANAADECPDEFGLVPCDTLPEWSAAN